MPDLRVLARPPAALPPGAKNYVGIDETDIDRNWISWLSPIAKALLNARLGQGVRFKFPSGEEELEILSIVYE
ncbi:MAG: GreA/GreB family elongation factor [Verrucomicrobia bacterium]|nr:GreA/GreB family elongation factor [Verrucomicrobiota bacterium]